MGYNAINQPDKFNINVSYLTEIYKHIIAVTSTWLQISDGSRDMVSGLNILIDSLDMIETLAFARCRKLETFIQASKDINQLKKNKTLIYQKDCSGRITRYYPEKAYELKERSKIIFRNLLIALDEKGMLTIKTGEISDIMGKFEQVKW